MPSDWHVFKEFGAGLTPFDISTTGDFRDDAQAAGGRRSGNQLAGNLDSTQHDALERSRNVTEQAVFDRVVLRATRRVVGNADVTVQSPGQLAEVLFEPVMPVAIAPSAVAQHQQAGGMPIAKAA
jgi:hypothetical protein